MAMTTVTFVGVDVGDWRDVAVRTGDRSLPLSYAVLKRGGCCRTRRATAAGALDANHASG